MTVLQIKKTELNFWQKLLSPFKPYKIETHLRRAEGVTVFTIVYTIRRGRIRFDKIYDQCIGRSKLILCDSSLDLSGTPFRRFFSYALQRQLMKNYLCDMLSAADTPSRIAFYDPQAQCPAMAEALLPYIRTLTIVTDMPRFYENEANRISDGCGAVINVSNDPSSLCPCDILISPAVIQNHLPTTVSTQIYTIAPPAVSLSGHVICRYPVSLPAVYRPLLPEGMDEEYFMSALYSLCRQTSLDRLTPTFV